MLEARARLLNFSLLLFFFCLFSNNIFAETQVFLPTKGLLFYESLEGVGASRAVSNIFQNPAGLAAAFDHQVKIEASQDYFGYNSLVSSYLMPTDLFNIGFGLYSFSCSDIPRVGREENARPQIYDYFSHINQSIVVALGRNINDSCSFGIVFQSLFQKLYNDDATGFSVDIGGRYFFDNFWVGGYSRNFIGSGYRWDESGVGESFAKKAVFEGGYFNESAQIKLSSDIEYTKGALEFFLTPIFSIVTDGVWQEGLRRYSYGVICSFPVFSFQYVHLGYLGEGLDIEQDLIGFIFHFGKQVEVMSLIDTL
jgi:hypothetical protein